MKETWKKTVPKWKLETNNTRLRKEDFGTVFKLALDSLHNIKSIIQNGFKACGLLPFDFTVVELDCLEKGKKKKKKNNFNESADVNCYQSAEDDLDITTA